MESQNNKKTIRVIILLNAVIIIIILALLLLQSRTDPQPIEENNNTAEEYIGYGDNRTPEQINQEESYTDPGINLISPNIQIEYDNSLKAVLEENPLSYRYPSPVSDANFTIMIGEEPVDCYLVTPDNQKIESVMTGTWSLDGNKIAFTKVEQPENASEEEGEFIANNIWVMNENGSNLKELYVDSNALNITYEIIGDKLAFATNYSVGTVDLQTGEAKVLHTFEAPISRSSEVYVPKLDIISDTTFTVEIRNLDYWQMYETTKTEFSLP